MKRKFANKYIVIACISLGLLASIQLKSISLENQGNSKKVGGQLMNELAELNTKEDKLKDEIEKIKINIDAYKNQSDDKALEQEIEKYERLAGYSDVSAQGVIVTITPNKNDEIPNDKNIMYNYDMILSIINKLNSAQANAISINGHRLVSETYIHLRGDKLYVDDVEINSPIVIKAIGDADTLSSALKIKYGIVWEIEQSYNAKVKVDKKKKVDIESRTSRSDAGIAGKDVDKDVGEKDSGRKNTDTNTNSGSSSDSSSGVKDRVLGNGEGDEE
ncbi:MAG: DUF881 domain-containing protein [Clostridioides sp.]|nr:DUF881 domain-containing protein [Clostridioides sp.]